MFGITTVCKAVAALAANVTQLAATVAEINAGVRGQLGMDGAREPLQIDEQPPEPIRNGRGRKAISE